MVVAPLAVVAAFLVVVVTLFLVVVVTAFLVVTVTPPFFVVPLAVVATTFFVVAWRGNLL